MSYMIKSNKYVRKLSISHVEIRSVASKREVKTQATLADSFIPFQPIILGTVVRPEMDRIMSWVGIFTMKFRKQDIEMFGVL